MSPSSKSLLRQKRSGSQVKNLMNATIKCSRESTVYGQCILRNYENISKDTCLAEFQAYKQCVQNVLGKKW